MLLIAFLYVAVAAFVAGNLYRVLRIARLPAHLRWELYPMPHGAADQQRYGGSYFEETEWWTKRPQHSWMGEFVYMAREILAFTTVRKRNRPLWLWSWLMHCGLYSWIATTLLIVLAALTRATWAPLIRYIVVIGSGAGLVGAAGLLLRRAIKPDLRVGTTRAAVFNLLLIAVIFASSVAAQLGSGADNAFGFVRALFGAGSAPPLSWPSTVHVVLVGVFLAYFPATHMTHAYMKFFTYHRVRWDDGPVVHDRAMEQSMAANVQRPISWSAPHIEGSGNRTWADVVARTGRRA